MKLLLIEDDTSIRNVLRLSFQSEGYTVDEADNGDDGSYLARTNHYDAIILDNILPKKLGKEVCKDIREAGKSIPVLFLSTKSDVLTKVDILDAGADDYLAKPFSYEELKARIRSIVRRPNNISAQTYTINGLHLDSDRNIVTLHDKEIIFTRKEFALLELLMKNKEMVISRGHIMEHVWDMNADPFSNTIESHILNIRKKLGDKKRALIKNIPGRGYKITTAC
jgi:DNA-binding response OmpR family regulator